ncbi:hypothetical protein [Burkholderia pseudomallei]|uniref:hypothetical protein n=1 Tax=Burkholderia pseudomallei TaxID=28450 RepID=UPI00100B8B66|nr:hypothetical protein [Burkholderia pseudomallei]
MSTLLATYVLIAVSRVNSGTDVAMQEFGDKAACEIAATAIRQMSSDVSWGGITRTWCVPKESK